MVVYNHRKIVLVVEQYSWELGLLLGKSEFLDNFLVIDWCRQSFWDFF